MQITISKPAQYIDVTPAAASTASIAEQAPGSASRVIGKRGRKGKRSKKSLPSTIPAADQPATAAAASPAFDKITGYDGLKGDSLVIDSASFGLRPDQCTFTWATCEPATYGAAEDPADIRFIYRTDTGYLYYNENGSAPGMGSGGVLAVFEGVPQLGLVHIM